MNVIYRVAFRLGSLPDPVPVPLTDVARQCVAWVFDHTSPQVERPAALAADTLAEVETCSIGPDVTFEATTAHCDGQHLWGLRFEHPDASQEHVHWRTELIARHDAIEGATHFACVQRRGSLADRVAPLSPAHSRPRIVETLLAEYGAWAGRPLQARPEVVRQHSVPAFLDLLHDGQRARPVVFVSARNVDDRPVTSADSLASWLCGLAHVLVADSRFPSLTLKDHLPERLRCWNGAVRVYWPAFRGSDDPFRHPLWTPERIRGIEAMRAGGFREHVLQRLADAATTSMGNPLESWEGLLSMRRRLLMTELRSAGRTDELIEIADETIRELEAKTQVLERELEQTRDEARRNQDKAESWRKAYETERRGAQVCADDQELLPIEDVADAVARAKEQFPSQILFQLNSSSAVDTNPFEAPESLWAALEWLATTYHAARTGQAAVPDFDISLREASGWKYQAHQSEVTMKKYRRWYTTRVDEKTVWLHEHVGTGSSKDARYTIRVGFDWDKDHQRVIIGFIGQHQQTDAT